jgi:MFS family permease
VKFFSKISLFFRQAFQFGQPARLFLLATIIDGTIYSAWSLFFNFFILARGYDQSFLGVVNAAPSFAALVLGIPLGLLSDRMGRRRAMLLGLAIYSLGALGQLLAPDRGLLLLASLAAGAGNTLYYLSQAPFMMKASTPQNRAMLFSLNFGLITLAGALGSILAGSLPPVLATALQVAEKHVSVYQTILFGAVAIGSLSLVPIFLIREPAEHQPGDSAPQPEKQFILKVLLRPVVLKLFIPNVLIGLGAAILIPYQNIFFDGRFGTSAGMLGFLFSISAVLTGVGSVIGPLLEELFGGKIRTVVITQAGSLFFLLLMGFSPYFSLAVVGFLVRAMLMNMASPLYTAFSMEQIEPHDQGAVNSLLNISWTAGWAVGPMISGVVQERWGFTPLFIATAGLYGLAILLSWWFFVRRPAVRVGPGEQA